MRIVIARCSVDYTGRLNAHLPLATRLLVHKGDGSLLVHSDGGSYKPLNWMTLVVDLGATVMRRGVAYLRPRPLLRTAGRLAK